MDKLEAMQVYVCVVDTHSFIRAAEVLGVPRSTVSRVVKELESSLKIQLLQRTTRKLSVTAEGRRYYEECKRVLADIAAMESSFPAGRHNPKGVLKWGCRNLSPDIALFPRSRPFAPVSGAGADTLFQR